MDYLKKPLWKKKFFDIFAIHSSSRHEKRCQMSLRLFSLFRGSIYQQWLGIVLKLLQSNSRPAPILEQKMKNKCTRKVIGSFSEISNLIRSSTQLLDVYIKDFNNEYYQWLLSIRKFLRFVKMYKITESQLVEMDSVLETMMNFRLKFGYSEEATNILPVFQIWFDAAGQKFCGLLKISKF